MINVNKKQEQIEQLLSMCEKDDKLFAEVAIAISGINVLSQAAVEIIDNVEGEEMTSEELDQVIEINEQLDNLYNTITLLTGINLLD